ncbi:hypothetical protein L3Q82_011664, partial [Scortum barcoo]
SFLSRLQIWANLVDPVCLLASDAEIQKAHALLGSGEKLDEKDGHALTLSLSSVHADSGAALPLIFRPPGGCQLISTLHCQARSVLAGNEAYSSYLYKHVAVTQWTLRVKRNVSFQFLLQSYSAGFNYANRNSSSEQQGGKMSLKQLLLIAGTVSYVTCAGALPQIFITRLGVRSASVQTFFKTALPVPLSAVLAFFNVFTVRSEESEAGIRVFNSSGNPVGLSKAAGEKAVRETALSRATLFGTTAAVPNVMVLLLQRTRLLQRNPLLATPLRHASTALVLALMIPVSFSLFPQLGTVRFIILVCCNVFIVMNSADTDLVLQIKKENVEEELQAAADNGQLYYHRGL